LASRLQFRLGMNTRHLLSLVTATLVLGTASASFAEAPSASVQASTTRQQRRFSLAAANTWYFGTATVGANAQYHLTDRLALGAQFSIGSMLIPVATAGAGARFFLNAEPTSGLFVDASAQAMVSMGVHGLGGAGELGYQYRGRSGFLFEASFSVLVLHIPEEPHPHVVVPEPEPVQAFPALNVRFGYAF
jgi:hypothetical protein